MRLSSLHLMLEVPPVKTWPPTMTGRAKSERQGVVGVRGERWILPGPREAVTEGKTVCFLTEYQELCFALSLPTFAVSPRYGLN